MTTGILPAIFLQYAAQAPLYLVWLVGIVLAVVRMPRHPRVSTLSMVAFVLFIVQSLIGTALSVWLPLSLSEGGLGASDIGSVFAFIGVFQTLISSAGWICLLIALFGWRGESNQQV
jgi:preprotein translocase subunit SecY